MTYLDGCSLLNLSVTPCLPINSITTLHPVSGIWEPWVPHKGYRSTRPFMLKHVQHRWHLSHSSSMLSGNLSPLICSCLVLISFSAGIIKLSRNTSVVCVVFFQKRLSFHGFHRYYNYSFDSPHGPVKLTIKLYLRMCSVCLWCHVWMQENIRGASGVCMIYTCIS